MIFVERIVKRGSGSRSEPGMRGEGEGETEGKVERQEPQGGGGGGGASSRGKAGGIERETEGPGGGWEGPTGRADICAAVIEVRQYAFTQITSLNPHKDCKLEVVCLILDFQMEK